MKNIYEVLRQKEQQSEQLQREIEALRLTIKILDGGEPLSTQAPAKSEAGTNGNTAVQAAPVAAGAPPKRFP